MSDEAALEALHARIRACSACRYPHAPLPTVEGQAHARILVVGQAPGKTEAACGRPWIGPAGKRLMRWMTEEVGFESPEAFRRQVYMAAVTRCYPGPNARGHGDRRPGPQEIANCRPYLAEALGLIKPAVLVLVGGLAIEQFLGKVPLDRVIGQAISMGFGDFAATLVPLPHPSGASTWLNAPAHQALLRQGLGQLRRLIREGGLAELGDAAA